ncbi:MAG: hypothetical protein HY696_04585 [Deltaproteobacteria bacterium]|nr:hypothetical protein [Deltaproteobacteria bacterium]
MLVDIQLAERREFASRERAFENAASSLDQTLFQVVTRAEALRWSQANTDVLADVTAIERSAGLRAGHHILALPPTIRTLRARGMCDIPDFYRRFLQAYTDTVHGFAIVAGLVEALKDSPSLLVALELAMDMAWESGLSPQDNYFDDLVDAVRRMELAGGDGTELRAIKAMPDIAWSKIGMIRQLHADQALEGHSSRATGLFVDWGMAVWDHVHWGVPLPVVTV